MTKYLVFLLGYLFVLIGGSLFFGEPPLYLDPVLGLNLLTDGAHILPIWLVFAAWLLFATIKIRASADFTKVFLVGQTIIAVPSLYVLPMVLFGRGFHSPVVWSSMALVSIFLVFYVGPYLVMRRGFKDEGIITLFKLP